MATVNGYTEMIAPGVARSVWTPMLNGDSGTPMTLPGYPDKTVQVLGTFGSGGTISIEGSNDGGTTWHILNDSRGEGNALTQTAADTRTILENPFYVRPRVTAGDGTTSLSCYIISRRGA